MAEQDLINLVAKAAHDLNDCVTYDVAEALAYGEDMDEWAALPLHVDDLAEFMVLQYAAYASFEEAADEWNQAELQYIDERTYHNAR